MQFRYVAYKLDKGILKGLVDARSFKEAQFEIARQGYKPLTIRKTKRFANLEDMFPSFFRVPISEQVRFCRYIAAMLISGGSLIRVLEMLEKETRNQSMRRILGDIRQSLDEGASLSIALKKHPTVFDHLFVSVVEVGEYTGRLGPALEQMADIIEKSQEAKQKAVRTMMYPVAIVGLALVTLGILMTVAMPPMLKVFDRMGAQMPLLTRMLIATFNFVKQDFMQIGVGCVVFWVLFALFRRISWVRLQMDFLQTRMPFIGPLTVAGELARFSRTLSMLLDAGVNLATALKLGISGVGNKVIRRALSDAEESLMTGHGLTTALKKHTILPSMFVELVMIGEESNSMKRTMRDAADAYQKQLEHHLNRFLAILEPASTLMVGGIVGLIAFSMFIPIYSGLNSFK